MTNDVLNIIGNIPANDILAHHGVKGMKWGIRRYQPYPKGSRSKGIFKGKESKARQPNVSKMSDQELRTKIQRLQMEKQYRDLTKKQISKGQKFATDIITNVAKQAATSYISKGVSSTTDKIKKKVGG